MGAELAWEEYRQAILNFQNGTGDFDTMHRKHLIFRFWFLESGAK